MRSPVDQLPRAHCNAIGVPLFVLLLGAGLLVASFALTASGADGNTVTTAQAPTLQSAVSRKLHGSAGTFDLLLSPNIVSPTTEPRTGSAGGIHTIVFTFDKAITGANVIVTEGTATAGAPTFIGNNVSVGLTGVVNARYVTISLTNVSSADGGTGGAGAVRIGFLAGDVNGSRNVTLSDLLWLDAAMAQRLSAANFLRDVNASGTLSLSDALLVDYYLSQVLPPPAGITCPGFAHTRVIELNWSAPVLAYTWPPGFGLSDAVVVKFTTGSISSTNNLPNITAVEYQSSPSSRTAVLSATPCDFGPQATPGASGVGNTVTAIFAVGTGSGFGYYPVLKTNTTYYLNIKNDPNSGCAWNGICDMSINLSKGTL